MKILKIFGDKKNIGNKAYNIYKLYEKGFLIPYTIIIEKKQISYFDYNLLKNNKIYILRPSFGIEDSKIKSFAGFFKSLYPLNISNIKIILDSKNIEEKFCGKGYMLNSIIIQEFVETNIYGVYFTRNPENILQKGFYEIGESNDEITLGKENSNKKLTFFQEKELEIIGKKIEKIFNYFQDIEFCIKDNNIIILQTRNITTGNNTIYNFNEIQKINGIYKNIDSDELGENQDDFSYKILNKLFYCIFIDSKIYIKSSIFPYLFLKKVNLKNKNLNLFYKNYKKYLILKIFFNITKHILLQKLEKKILIDFFKNYKYSFLLGTKSNLKLKFDYGTNFITRFFLKIEKQKNLAFSFLEKYKNEFKVKNTILQNNNKLNNILIFYKGTIVNKNIKDNEINYIYKGKIEGIITDLKNFDYKKENQVLICNELDFNIYDKLDKLKGIIILKGNKLSHNSIILREYKIPSIINYKDFDKLKIGGYINL